MATKKLIAPEVWEPEWEQTLELAEAAAKLLEHFDSGTYMIGERALPDASFGLRAALIAAGYQESD